ncbi:adenylyl cyclase-associated protein 1 isoform X1 [Harpegnathos saltator]|uniref:Adenylyl cyclase-associated protein n=3 Tax=Harpegnathos saltator TaxID=610380 RepID=E2BWC7_HARSA|nr:adenylyl cyclase-associated protein 1 isoform X1 [Harpegnathos saltator]EFN80031.1 Adenylyl cyclase-associated protein 1 [Harpegnathos saltator]
MFKCCRCTSSKGSQSNTDSDSNDTPTSSRKMIEKVDDETGTSPKAVKANGDVPRAEETEEAEKVEEVPVEESALLATDAPALPAPEESPSEQQEAEGSEDKAASKAAEAEVNKAEVSPEEKSPESGAAGEEATLQIDEHEDVKLVKEISSLATAVMKEIERVVEEGPRDEEQSSEKTSAPTGEKAEASDDGPVGDQAEGDAAEAKVLTCAAKTNLYCDAGYIERTVDDGADDEGDDSVFEGESDAADKAQPAGLLSDWATQQHDLLEKSSGEHVREGCSGMQEPPATPVARDELALRRHRFFSELLQVAQNTEHRVRFDPLGPRVHTGCGEVSDRDEYLEQLVNRLEDVTRRLEKVPVPSSVQTQETSVQVPSPKSTPARNSSSTQDSPQSSSDSICSSERIIPEQSASMSVAGFEDLLAGPVKEYLELSQKIGGDVAAHSKLVEKAFQFQLQFIHTAASRAAPANQSEHVALLEPMSAQIQRIQEFREKNRGSPFFNHLSAISESIPALGWVAVSPTPAPYVKEMNDAGQFYTNRVLKDWKEKDKMHIDWCKAWVQTLTDLQQYVRQHHTTGLVWGKTGAAPAGIPPPPPPSMPIGDIIAPLSMINDDRSALFAQINQGEDITKNLKKVTSDMQTHKNPSLRSGPAPFKAPAIASVTPMKNVLPANAPIDKPSVFTRDGKKWLVEYQKGENLMIDNAEMNNVVYIFRCQDSTLTVKGKVNSVVMDSCRKSSIVFDSLVSSIEFVNCQSVQMQVLGKVPTISIDKTDGCQMYLSADSLDVELITSKSSEMNVMVPKANGDYAEYPVPEQFKTTISHNGLSTTAIDSLG